MFYRIKENHNSKVGKQGKFYAKAVTVGTTETEELATIMQRNSTVKRSDIKAVIEELIETMADQLKQGRRVKLNGLGTFKLGLKSGPADSLATFNAREHVKGLKVLFTPESSKDSSGSKSKVFLSDVPVQELPEYRESRATAAAAARQGA